jgi:hypothetical protein
MSVSDSVTYYAIVNEFSDRERPAGVFRRTYFDDGGMEDEAFSRGMTWERSWLLASAERGDTANEFIEISKEEADEIVERFRQQARSQES